MDAFDVDFAVATAHSRAKGLLGCPQWPSITLCDAVARVSLLSPQQCRIAATSDRITGTVARWRLGIANQPHDPDRDVCTPAQWADLCARCQKAGPIVASFAGASASPPVREPKVPARLRLKACARCHEEVLLLRRARFCRPCRSLDRSDRMGRRWAAVKTREGTV